MMDAETKKAVRARLRRIAGQAPAVERMVDADRYCIDLMQQLAAAQAATGKVSGRRALRSAHEGDTAMGGNGLTSLLYFLAFGLNLVVIEERCLGTTYIAAGEEPAAAPTNKGEARP